MSNKKESTNTRISKENLIKIFFHIFRQFDNLYYTGFAATIAYFFFMASMPTMIVISQLLGIFDVSLDFIKDWLELHVDSNISGFVMGLFSATSVKFTNVLMILLALWSASGLEFSLSRLSSYTLSEGRFRFKFFKERFRAIPYSIVSLVTIAFSLVIFVYGDALFNKLFTMTQAGKLLLALRTPIAAGLFFAMVLVNYYLMPRIRVPIKAILPGSIVASVGIMLVTIVYSIYIGYIADYNILYGTFANIVALMLWFYLISWVLCIGIMFNKAWDEIMGKGMLTESMMVEYIKRQYGEREDKYRKYIIEEEDAFNPDMDSIAVKLSRKYVPGYQQELKAQKKKEEKIRFAINEAVERLEAEEAAKKTGK